MNQKLNLNTDFGPDVRFEVPAQPTAPFRATLETELEQLKARLLADALQAAEPAANAPLRRAANDAAALVWLTPVPLLLLPELFAEKARTAIQQAKRQARVFIRSRALLAEAA